MRLSGKAGGRWRPVVAVYRVNAQRAGEEPYAAIVSSTFVRGGGRWLMAFDQQSPV